MFNEEIISKAIVERYNERYLKSLKSDVIVVGAGPSGLIAAIKLAEKGYNVVIIERKLAPGGGIWGGGMMMSEVVIQEEAKKPLEELGIRHKSYSKGIYTVDAVEMASALILKAVHAGANILNMHHLEDVTVHGNKVVGVVVNRTNVTGVYQIDPIMFSSKAVLDATGHDAVVVGLLKKRKLIDAVMADGIMNAFEGESFVVEKAGEIFPGLFISGMSVCAAYGGPRMGPIFGGMILSGIKIAGLIAEKIKK